MKVIGIDKNGNEIAEVSVTELDAMFKEIRAKAIDEFAERMKEKWIESDDLSISSEFFDFVEEIADEMRGAE